MKVTTTNLQPTVPIIPKVAITILVDVFYIMNNQGDPSAGIYMFDNTNSPNEGSPELTTSCMTRDIIGWNILPIDYLNPAGDAVIIESITCEGNIFGNQLPTSVTPPGSEPAGAYWIAQAVNASPRLTYQPTLRIAIGAINPQYIYVTWDPFITVNN